MDKMKVCRTCEIPKPLDAFYDQKGGTDNKQPTCKQCKNQYGAKWRSMQTIGDAVVCEMMRRWAR